MRKSDAGPRAARPIKTVRLPARTRAPDPAGVPEARRHPFMSTHSRHGFTLIEVIVVASILAILAGALIPRVTNHMAESRDARRLNDIQAVRAAIEQYFADHQRYPAGKANSSYGGWDVSNDGDFIPELVQDGYLPEPARDPGDDDLHYYAYYLYDKGTAGCESTGKFYVLGVKAYETSEYATQRKGFLRCASRDWSTELDYVTGGGTSLKP